MFGAMRSQVRKPFLGHFQLFEQRVYVTQVLESAGLRRVDASRRENLELASVRAGFCGRFYERPSARKLQGPGAFTRHLASKPIRTRLGYDENTHLAKLLHSSSNIDSMIESCHSPLCITAWRETPSRLNLHFSNSASDAALKFHISA